MAAQNLKYAVVEATKATGVLPCIKLKHKADWLEYAEALYEGGARVVEVTMTTPGALEAIAAISGKFADNMFVAAGTVLDASTARAVILSGGSLLVSPAMIPEVIDMGHRYGVPTYIGAFSPTEVLAAMRGGATMVKIFPARIGGPAYMTNLKMVYPDVDLIPSGGISLENAGDYIRCGACAVSGARTFMNREIIEREGVGAIALQMKRFIEIVRQARHDAPRLP